MLIEYKYPPSRLHKLLQSTLPYHLAYLLTSKDIFVDSPYLIDILCSYTCEDLYRSNRSLQQLLSSFHLVLREDVLATISCSGGASLCLDNQLPCHGTIIPRGPIGTPSDQDGQI